MVTRLLLIGMFVMAASDHAVALRFTEIARFNVDAVASDPMNPQPHDIGVTASAVGWNGSRLYLAGFNNSGVSQGTAIVEVLNATTLGLVETPTFSSAFGQLSTPASRGYSGLDLSPDGTQLAAAWDNGQVAAEGLRVYDTGNHGLSWSKAIRGGSGVAFDPGHRGGSALGQGVAWVRSFDSGRRSLQDASTGSDIWTPADGMIWHPLTAGLSFVTRDIDFDPNTGDMYTRTANDVIFARRGDDNTIVAKGILANEADSIDVNNQHLAFLNNVIDYDVAGNYVIYNDRSSVAAGQAFVDVNRVVDNNGYPPLDQPNFRFISRMAPDAGNGLYDYDFDDVTQTLAILDSLNHNVHIFAVGGGSPCAGEGDFNCSGMVGGDDLDMVFRFWGQPAHDAPPEWFHDPPMGTIGADELDRVLFNWGNVTMPAPVPEPAASCALVIGFLVCFLPRRSSTH